MIPVWFWFGSSLRGRRELSKRTYAQGRAVLPSVGAGDRSPGAALARNFRHDIRNVKGALLTFE
jgi:hypothetical protein